MVAEQRNLTQREVSSPGLRLTPLRFSLFVFSGPGGPPAA